MISRKNDLQSIAAGGAVTASSFLVALFAMTALSAAAGAEIDFNRDIRPILSDKCFTCHGPDKNARKAELRLDRREDALASKMITPGNPDESEVYLRVIEADPDERMPPKKTHKVVSAKEAELLRKWIGEGAEYAGHWAFEPVRKPDPPQAGAWAENPIDHFILERLNREGFEPSPAADARTLLRRVTIDLTGLPPTPEEVEAFLKNPDLAARIDELMRSPRYGEHMAWSWLDAARYADSDGYESDPLRNMWPWRDWVVDAFNRHMPYDQFVIEQLAGDQLENPTLRQKLATGFNRNHRLNNEGGIDPDEWLIEYVCDRAETTATVFMGLTWQCARCHDHKYDPISAGDYYQLFSFFHQLPEKGSANARTATPLLQVSALPHLEEFAELTGKLKPLETELAALRKHEEFEPEFVAWLDTLAKNEEARKKLGGDFAKKEVAKWDDKLKNEAKTRFLKSVFQPAKPLRAKMAPLEKRVNELRASGATVMVMEDMAEPRQSHVLLRGAFDSPGEPVSAGTPAWLPPMDDSLPRNRLGLAKWLVDPEHPLTARVAVNRIWARFFGTGLVKTAEDFGSQGELPSHPQLLDFLASWFVENGWDVQALQKLILTSATYQQSSRVTAEHLERDPENRLLARGPRYRWPAPVIRDQSLAASGLFVEKLGGPPVKPYQPPGLWKEVIKGSPVYTADTGEKLYRRSIYSLWRRAVKPPMMTLLDSNLRDTCAVDLKRTNTPLQALLLLNDVTFVEHARGLASRMILESDGTDEGRIERGMMLLLGRAPAAAELAILKSELAAQRAYFRSHPDAVSRFLSVGEAKPNENLDSIELAATTAVARVLLNLDETLTKE